ncbi:hypothetical protein [Parasphingorhabdus halotolerans]|uniref:Acid phosphatase n=1 Tax=Parasphingorhabdus halotolerans TaxID=2725558 RepID=A0A6H2DNA3_9SPHN|nr:hypothetical protein [Parasphingorhabdus halotolerans]QJB70139.1 hypothetical protein HF685_13275 [Parasphingorhabdus halotolerans]
MAISVVPLLSGCVAALLPIAAAGMMGKTEIDRVKAKREFVASGAVEVFLPTNVDTVLAAETSDSRTDFTGQGGAIDEPDTALSDESRQYLSRFFRPLDVLQPRPYDDFARYALGQAVKLEAGEGVKSAVLVPRVDIFKPKTVRCEGKPLAVLIDMDDKSNSGWSRSETLYRQNGLVEALGELRAAKISVIWLSDEPSVLSDRISAILKDAELSASGADDFLFLDRGGEDRKQERRWDAANNYCIVAMAGDSRSDFDELYDYLRDPDGAITLEHMFGNGWFIAPPPLVTSAGDDAVELEEEG